LSIQFDDFGSVVSVLADPVDTERANVVQTTPVDSESIADEFRIGVYSDKHDFTNHLKVAVREGLDPLPPYSRNNCASVGSL